MDAHGLRFPVGMIENERVFLVLPSKVAQRLGETCFRGKALEKAGNFFRWDSFTGIWHDFRVQIEHDILEAVRRFIERGKRGPEERLHYASQLDVGWDSTTSIEGFTDDELETFTLNKHSSALRVKHSANRLAPRTNRLTLICRIEHEAERWDWAAVVYSVYPGEDVGKLRGPVSSREGLVFFDFENPGAPDPEPSRMARAV